MEELRLADVAACVVGWHNRHPLARRIGASHVHAIGYVALPFSGGGAALAPEAEAQAPEAESAGTLRERAEKRARQAQEPPVVVELALDRKTLKPAFSEDFIDPLSPREVARFAKAHAQALARAPADGPLRAVRAEGAAPLTLYLMTAVVETGTRKSRVLVGGGARPRVLGRRVLQPARVALAALPLALLVAGGAAFWPRGSEPAAVVAALPAASAPPSAPSSAAPASAASAPAPVMVPPTSPEPVAAAPAAASAVQAAALPPAPAAASAPAVDDGQPHLGRIAMPSIKPRLNARAAAAEAAASAHAAAAPAVPAPAPVAVVAPVPAPPPAAARASAPAAPPPPPAFALSTRPLRTRAEADQTRVAMKSLLAAVNARGVQVDVLPEGDDWRVVGMPFSSRAEADKARALLVSRGMKVQVVGF